MPTIRPLALTIFSLLLLTFALRVEAAEILVSVTTDEVAVNGNCSLREAVIAANTDSAVDRCRAGAGADTIFLPGGTYVLSLVGPNEDAAQTGDLDVVGNITIHGAGATSTIIEGGSQDYWLADRVIDVLHTGTLALIGATVRGGACGSGAGILNAGTASVVDSRVEDNYAGMYLDNCSAASANVYDFGAAGILNAPTGVLVVTGSTLSWNWVSEADLGGGLINYGHATIDRTFLMGNWGAAGGAVVNMGDLEVVDSQIGDNGGRFNGAALVNLRTATLRRTTISNNVTDHAGAAVENGTWGHSEALLVLDTSTVSGNTGYYGTGSVINYAGNVQISGSTIAVNSGGWPDFGGVTSYAQTTLLNTIMANAGGNCAGTIVSLGNNLDSDGSCGLSAPGDLGNTNPMIGPLADNGGPTPTHALLPGSPAIDHIPTVQCSGAYDQRKIVRPYPRRGACDIGAYEFSLAGDIFFLRERVKSGYRAGAINKAQEYALLDPLRAAEVAATMGNSQGTCAILSDFMTLVSGYVSNGSLTAAAAQPLLDSAARIRNILCP